MGITISPKPKGLVYASPAPKKPKTPKHNFKARSIDEIIEQINKNFYKGMK